MSKYLNPYTEVTARDEGRAEGRVEGIEKGRAEGRAEGRLEGEIAVLRRLLVRRWHLLRGQVRQDELVLRTVLILAIILAVAVTVYRSQQQASFWPFMFDWRGMYEDGLIDAKEWKDNRFRYF